MKTRFSLPISLVLLVTLVFLSFPTFVFAGNPQATGLNQPSPTQKQWIKDNFPVIQKLNLNKFALERINNERESKGQKKFSKSEFNLAPLGQEAVFSSISSSTDTSVSSAVSALGSVDNSLLAAFPPIRSQGSLGSCAAWATTYYQLTYETNLALGRTASSGDNSAIFSPKWTYNMINGGANAGAYFSDAYNLEIKNGAASWADFPYDSNYLAWPMDPATWSKAINYRPQTWGQISNTNIDSLIIDLKTQLANGHIMVIGTYVNSWVKTTVKNDPSTTQDDSYVNQYIASYMKNTASGAHAMTLVGYNDNLWCDLNANGIVDSGEKGAFKIANSWGTSDWNAGFRWVTYDSLRTTSAVSSYGSWPTTDRANGGIFWSGNIFTLAVTSYAPSVLAEVTLNTANRGQTAISLGLGSSSSTTPASTWTSKAVYYTGGSYAFNGTTTACDGTFYFDFSDLAELASGTNRWFVKVADSASGSPVTLSSFKLYKDGVAVATSSNPPVTVDAGQDYVWLDYVLNPANDPPVASLTATPTSGNLPLVVSFDGTASSDLNGPISSYSWNFGDGFAIGTGATVSHTYTSAGKFTATLTVTDSDGATDTDSITITVNDPNILNAPTNLSISANKRVVTLNWNDNSNNETGFYIERGVKNKATYTYTKIGQVSSNVTNFVDSLAASGTYYYRVQAFNADKQSTYSNVVSVRVK